MLGIVHIRKQKPIGLCYILTNNIYHLSWITTNLSECTYSLTEWIVLHFNHPSLHGQESLYSISNLMEF